MLQEEGDGKNKMQISFIARSYTELLTIEICFIFIKTKTPWKSKAQWWKCLCNLYKKDKVKRFILFLIQILALFPNYDEKVAGSKNSPQKHNIEKMWKYKGNAKTLVTLLNFVSKSFYAQIKSCGVDQQNVFL